MSLAYALPALAQSRVQQVAVQARQIPHFQIGREGGVFGSLEFVGGMELTGSSRNFGGFSAFRFRTPGRDFIGVTDAGYWFFGRVERGPSGEPVGYSDFTLQQFVDKSGRRLSEKKEVDAEGIAVRGDTAAVGFERRHRISEFHIDPANMAGPQRDLNFLVPRAELRENRGFEAIAYAPADSALGGALVAVSEKSLDKKGNVFAAILDGPQKGIFTVRKDDRYDITDSAFLPDGDLLLLERSFSFSRGVGMRLRRIPADQIVSGADAADGPVLLEAGMTYQIDNMEAMDVWTRGDGATIVSLMSDDNLSMFQRSIYLEFRLNE